MFKRIVQISINFFCFLYTTYLLHADFQIFNIEQLNTNDDDYAPAVNFVEKTLFYNWSNKTKSQLLKRKISFTVENLQNNFLDIFSDKSVLVSDNITKSGINPVYLSFWGNECYLTGKVKSTKGVLLGIYKSDYEKNNWQITRLLDELGTDRFNFHPTISPNGNTLVYCTASISNPEDSDLMIAYRDEKKNWSSSIPLNILNSNLSEITPFFASDDTLYFASNGLDGRGGFDIFYSIFEDGAWQTPKPVQGVNTEFDESDFTKVSDDLYFFVSNRPGGKGGLDIWGYYLTSTDWKDEEPVFKTSLNSTILRIINISSYIQLVNNTNIKEIPANSQISQDSNFYYIYYDSVSSNPTHLEISYHISKLVLNNYYQLIVRLNDRQVISKNISQKDTSVLIPVREVIDAKSIPEKLEIYSQFTIRDKELSSTTEVEVYKSRKENFEIFDIDNKKYKLIVVPLSPKIDQDALEKSLKFLKQEVKYKNGKIIIESSPTFELYDNEKIRSYINNLNINNNAIIYQTRVSKNLSKYFNNLNFNYLLIYIQI